MVSTISILALVLSLGVWQTIAMCPATWCNAVVNGDFIAQDTTPPEWVVRPSGDDTALLLPELPQCVVKFSRVTSDGPVLRVIADAGNQTVLYHRAITLPTTSRKFSYHLSMLIPQSDSSGYIRVKDNLGRSYYKHSFAKRSSKNWVEGHHEFVLKPRATTITFEIVLNAGSSATAVYFRYINICIPSEATRSKPYLGYDRYMAITGAKCGSVLHPWQATGKLRVESDPKNIFDPKVVVAENTASNLSTTVKFLSAGEKYRVGGWVKGSFTWETLPVRIAVDGKIISDASAIQPVNVYHESDGDWTGFSNDFNTTVTSAKITYVFKAGPTATLWHNSLKQIGCQAELVTARSAPDEL